MFHERANNLKALGEAFRPLVVPAADLSYVEKTPPSTLRKRARRTCRPLRLCLLRALYRGAIEAALNAYVADKGLKFKGSGPAAQALMGFMGGSHLVNHGLLGKQNPGPTARPWPSQKHGGQGSVS